MTEKTYLYRCQLYGEQLTIEQFEIIKKTPCGAWIDDFRNRRKRFVLGGDGNRYAHATHEDAVYAFYRRKKRQVEILKHQLEVAKIAHDATSTEELRKELLSRLQPHPYASFKTVTIRELDNLYSAYGDY